MFMDLYPLSVGVRLVGGRGGRRCEGRVEVIYNNDNDWGTVCDDRWNETVAQVYIHTLSIKVLYDSSPSSFHCLATYWRVEQIYLVMTTGQFLCLYYM